MTPKEKKIYSLKWIKFQQRYEKAYTGKFISALQIQVNAYIKSRDLMMVPSYPIYDVLLSLYKNIGVDWANFIRRDVNKAEGQMGFNQRIAELIKQYYNVDLLNDAELMTQYSRSVIADVLSKAAETGMQYSDIVEILLQHPEFNRIRAMRIARTETVTAANGAAAIYANDSGLIMDKIWIAIKDKRTRRSHLSVTTEPIPMDQPFQVGAALMMQPGARNQPNGIAVPAEEVVNCRCTVGYIPKRGSDGRILRK
jgi:hypothetical protein